MLLPYLNNPKGKVLGIGHGIFGSADVRWLAVIGVMLLTLEL